MGPRESAHSPQTRWPACSLRWKAPSAGTVRGGLQGGSFRPRSGLPGPEGPGLFPARGPAPSLFPLPCAVHPQRQESGSGREADHRWKRRGAPRGLLEPRGPRFVPGHPRAAGLLSRPGLLSTCHVRLCSDFRGVETLLWEGKCLRAGGSVVSGPQSRLVASRPLPELCADLQRPKRSIWLCVW